MVFLLVPTSAIEVTSENKIPIIISELNDPARFNITINNPGETEQIEIFTLLGIAISPKGNINLPPGKTTLEIRAFFPEEMRKNTGNFNFEYQIKGTISGLTKKTLTANIIPLKDTLKLENSQFALSDKDIFLTVRNTKNVVLSNVKIDFTSEFFSETKTLDLEPLSEKIISISLDKEKVKNVPAGQYTMTATTNYNGVETLLDGAISFTEQQSLDTAEKTEGLIVRKQTTAKTNNGNVQAKANIETTRNILTRLFTTHSQPAQTTERTGLLVNYRWQANLGPGESWTVSTTTNYTFPVIVLLLIIIIAFLAHRSTQTPVTVRKQVSFVKTKGGQFALKIQLRVKAHAETKNLHVVDRIPHNTKIYDQFGIKPDKVDVGSRRLFWKLPVLRSGEERVFSYIIYSNIGVVGRYVLPTAAVVFEEDGTKQTVHSNQAIFMAETGVRD